MVPSSIPIEGCDVVPVQANADARGCLFEIFRENWQGAFHAVQWNACASSAGVTRGVHVHADYHEFYTLPRGRVILGLHDIRRGSSTFGQSSQFEWADSEGKAIVVPVGVAHVVYFVEDSVLAFGLSNYWNADLDVNGCQWNDPKPGFKWDVDIPKRSDRDENSGSYDQMIAEYEVIRGQINNQIAV